MSVVVLGKFMFLWELKLGHSCIENRRKISGRNQIGASGVDKGIFKDYSVGGRANEGPQANQEMTHV